MPNSILFTREQKISVNLRQELESCSFQLAEIPLISLEICQECVDKTLIQNDYDWIFFTSAAAVRFFYEAYGEISSHVKLAVIGSKTFEELKTSDQSRADYPDIFTSEYFVEEWLSHQTSCQKVLFPQSELSRGIIQKRLIEEGHYVRAFTLYNNFFPEHSKKKLLTWLDQKTEGAIVVFASPSAWHNFYSLYKLKPFDLQFASIGPITSHAIMKNGYSVAYEAPECTLDSLTRNIMKK
ncbi:uroporphyrinogen-III synthase [Vagococcus fessus]|nr:uroporphyrinogen-III synthase [Vagococcus fessus]